MCPDLFKLRSIQPAIPAGSGHPLDTTPPVFDQAQFLKYSTQDAVAQFRNALLDVFDG